MPAGLSSFWNQLLSHPQLLALAVASAVLAWAFGPNLSSLIHTWNFEPNYSHGFLVIPIALTILWRRLSEAEYTWTLSRPAWWSWGLLIAVLAIRAIAYERGLQWTENATIIPAVGCLLLVLGGPSLLSVAWPAVLFLVFMLPLPPSLNMMVAAPLQRLATRGSSFMFQLTGLWTIPEGNVITLRTKSDQSIPLEVAQACNGLSMLMTLAATVTATVILLPMPNWKRIVILLSAVPIALMSNIARILATGWCYYFMEGERAKQYAHDWSGYLMMPLALILVGLELALLNWLALDERDPEADRPIGPLFPSRSS